MVGVNLHLAEEPATGLESSYTYHQVLGMVHWLAALMLEEGAEAHRCRRFVQHDGHENYHAQPFGFSE